MFFPFDRKEYPFEYGEFQNQPIIFSSFKDIKTHPFSESPYKKQQFKIETSEKERRKISKYKRYDFWVETDFGILLIEYKHIKSFLCKNICKLNNNSENKFETKWGELNIQLKNIGKKVIKEHVDSINYRKVALIISPLYRKGTSHEKYTFSDEEQRDNLYSQITNNSHQLDIVGYLPLSENAINQYIKAYTAYRGNLSEYPEGILFMAYIEKPPKKKR